MPESKELIEYVDANIISRGIVGMHFFRDMECLLPKNYLQHQQRIKDLEVFEDDIWILSYPKCGTTWCQEMVWLVANNLDYNGADVFIDTRYSFMEFGTFVDHDKINTSKNILGAPIVPDTLKQAEDMPRPRFIKSHLPLALLPTQLFKTKPKNLKLANLVYADNNFERKMVTGDEEAVDLMKCILEKCEFFDDGLHFYPKIKCPLPTKYLESEKRIRDFTVYEDDVWVLTYPKCGTTWSQEMVWLIGNDLDYKGAEVALSIRFPYVEFAAIFAGNKHMVELSGNTVDIVEQMSRPRYIKSHLPLALLPAQMAEKKPKIVYVMRNPKDVAVSFYYHHKLLHAYDGSMETFFKAFIQGRVYYGCYLHHIAAFWKLRHEPNICLLTYEEMKNDLPSVIRRTATFLDKSLTGEQVATLAEHLSFAKMKENPAVNLRKGIEELQNLHKKSNRNEENIEFIRKGEVGDYRNKMSPEMTRNFDEWVTAMKRLFDLDKDNEFPY